MVNPTSIKILKPPFLLISEFFPKTKLSLISENFLLSGNSKNFLRLAVIAITFLLFTALNFSAPKISVIGTVCLAQQGIIPEHRATEFDRITLTESPEVREGTILNITGREGVLFLPKGKQESLAIPLGKIARLETPLTLEHQKGNDAYQKALRFSPENSSESMNDTDYFRQALQFYLTARNSSEKRTWLRLWLTARIVQCHLALLDQGNAVREFFLLCQTDPYTPWIHSIPLQWTESTGGFNDSRYFQLEQMASPWLGTSQTPSGKRNPTASLLAASILLQGSPTFRTQAKEALQQLVSAPSAEQPALQERIADLSRLATAQIWRRTLYQKISEQELESRLKMINLLPDELRPGPVYLIALSLAESEKPENSISYFLRLPLLYPDQRELARAALVRTAKILKDQNRTDELNRIQPDLTKFGLIDSQ